MFKDNFVRLLQQHGITALKLSQDTCIPKSIVYEWRNGVRLPNAENLSKLSHYFGVSLDELVGGEADGVLSPPDGEERDLIVLLRAAREVSGEERERIIEKFRRSMEKYLDESDGASGGKSAKQRRGHKKRGPDQA